MNSYNAEQKTFFQSMLQNNSRQGSVNDIQKQICGNFNNFQKMLHDFQQLQSTQTTTAASGQGAQMNKNDKQKKQGSGSKQKSEMQQKLQNQCQFKQSMNKSINPQINQGLFGNTLFQSQEKIQKNQVSNDKIQNPNQIQNQNINSNQNSLQQQKSQQKSSQKKKDSPKQILRQQLNSQINFYKSKEQLIQHNKNKTASIENIIQQCDNLSKQANQKLCSQSQVQQYFQQQLSKKEVVIQKGKRKQQKSTGQQINFQRKCSAQDAYQQQPSQQQQNNSPFGNRSASINYQKQNEIFYYPQQQGLEGLEPQAAIDLKSKFKKDMRKDKKVQRNNFVNDNSKKDGAIEQKNVSQSERDASGKLFQNKLNVVQLNTGKDGNSQKGTNSATLMQLIGNAKQNLQSSKLQLDSMKEQIQEISQKKVLGKLTDGLNVGINNFSINLQEQEKPICIAPKNNQLKLLKFLKLDKKDNNPICEFYKNEKQINQMQQQIKNQLEIQQNQGIQKTVFKFHYVIGKGGFGKVWKVQFRKTSVPFAMKEMMKAKVIAKRSVNSVMNERILLSALKEIPGVGQQFLINIHCSFQDRDNLYLVMDYLSGGDLRYHIGRERYFSEIQTKFFVACIVIGLDFMHSNQIIHRDIKPENLILGNDGYVRITDLGIAKKIKPENSEETSGTPGYMAPEVMCRQNHGIAVDYFALGVMAYEFMLGRRPYLGRCRKEIRDAILAKQVQVKRIELPEGWSIEAMDFINKMLQRKPQNRLGFNGANEVKQHPWLKDFPWDKLSSKQLPSPYIPSSIEDNFDYNQQISLDNSNEDELVQQSAVLLKKSSVQNLFVGYNYESDIQNAKNVESKLVPNDIGNQFSQTLKLQSQLHSLIKFKQQQSNVASFRNNFHN